jgi:hypothetical protein
VVDVHINGRKRFWGHHDHCDDLLVSLPQEDRVRKVSFSFYAIDLADVRVRTDSMIITLVVNTINSAFLLR